MGCLEHGNEPPGYKHCGEFIGLAAELSAFQHRKIIHSNMCNCICNMCIVYTMFFMY